MHLFNTPYAICRQNYIQLPVVNTKVLNKGIAAPIVDYELGFKTT